MADITKRFPDCDDDDGRRGKRGHRGPTGPTGASGSAGASTIIPFASGEPDTLVHVIGGLLDTGAVVGFGASLDGIAVGGGTVDLTGAAGVPSNMAFSMPRDGTLTDLAAFFSLAVAALFPPGGVIVVQVYRSTTPDNSFSPVPGALVEIPLPTNVLPIGTFASGTASFAVPVSAGDRLLLVARFTVTPDEVGTSVVGYVSAGLAIE
jgi:BclB C-terminal domain-containing protein